MAELDTISRGVISKVAKATREKIAFFLVDYIFLEYLYVDIHTLIQTK
jgi:hypothetical protein